MLKVAKQMRNARRDVVDTNLIKDESHDIIIAEDGVRE